MTILKKRIILRFFQDIKLVEFTAANLKFHPVTKKEKNTTRRKTKIKKKLAITKNAFSVRSRRLRGLFPIARRRNLCKQRSGEKGLDHSLKNIRRRKFDAHRSFILLTACWKCLELCHGWLTPFWIFLRLFTRT